MKKKEERNKKKREKFCSMAPYRIVIRNKVLDIK